MAAVRFLTNSLIGKQNGCGDDGCASAGASGGHSVHKG